METTDSLFSLENVLAVTDGAKRDGNAYVACCPAHPDKHPSLRISRGRSGNAVVFCFSCSDKRAAFQTILQRIKNRIGSGTFAPSPSIDLEPEEDNDFDSTAALCDLRKWQDARRDVFADAPYQFLAARGITESVTDDLGYGYSEDRNALVLPTFWQGSLIGLKFRSLTANPGRFKWWQVRGSNQDILMGADLEPVNPDSRVVAVFEAPLDFALVRSLGFNAVTVISSHIPDTERFRTGIALLREKYDHVLLVGDNDASGIAAMEEMRRLIGTGATFARLPDGIKDIGDFHRENPTDAKQWLTTIFAMASDCTPIPRGSLREKVVGRLLRAVDILSHESDPLLVLPALRNDLAALQPVSSDFPKPLTPTALCGLVREFVDAALPYTEASAEALAYQFLAAAGNLLGMSLYANFGADRHYPSLFTFVIGNTASGKGQSLSAVRSLMRLVDPGWESNHWRSSAASGEGLVRMASENQDDGRLFLTLPEMSTLLNSMGREGSNLSGYLRLAYDRAPLENQKSKGGIVARDYLLSAVGHITPAELTETLGGVDFYNGAVNRFLWAVVNKSKTLPRMGKTPDFGPLAEKMRSLLALPEAGCVGFSSRAATEWDSWVYSLPELDGKLEAACERSKPNALRLALIYAALDEDRLTNPARPTEIREAHVRAAIELVTRSRESVAWFLSQPIQIDAKGSYEDVVRVRSLANKEGGRITATQLTKLFSHKTAEQRLEIASRAGLKLRKDDRSEKSGRPVDVWTW
jgi:hypothetical protein